MSAQTEDPLAGGKGHPESLAGWVPGMYSHGTGPAQAPGRNFHSEIAKDYAKLPHCNLFII